MTPPLTLRMEMDQSDMARFLAVLDSADKRSAEKHKIGKILQRALEPVAKAEKAYFTSRSGALAESLVARSTGGRVDRPDVVSAFVAPTATTEALAQTWGRGRAQQRGWKLKPRRTARQKIFYATMVHQGHRIVRRNAAGELYDTGKRAKAVPFAAEAMAELGEQQGEAAAEELLNYIWGESDNG